MGAGGEGEEKNRVMMGFKKHSNKEQLHRPGLFRAHVPISSSDYIQSYSVTICRNHFNNLPFTNHFRLMSF